MNFKSLVFISISMATALCLNACHSAPKPNSKLKTPRENATLTLDGKMIPVYWDDGDTFEFRENGRKTRARLKGFNTLESYGPVHSWGDWSAIELYEVAFQATAHARSQNWECSRTKSGGGYGRILVDCPELRRSILSQGLAHVFWMNEAAPNEIVEPQHQAIQNKVGMWKKGSPDWILTSIHSATEDNLPKPYNRMVSTKTGEAKASNHSKRYQTCQKVCESESCMVYVPYRIRYGKKRANCLIIQ